MSKCEKVSYFHSRINAIADKYVNELSRKEKSIRHPIHIDEKTIEGIVNGSIKTNKITQKKIADYFANKWKSGYSQHILELLIDQESMSQFNTKDNEKLKQINELVEAGRKQIRASQTTNLDKAYLVDNTDLLSILQSFDTSCQDIVNARMKEIKAAEEK